MRLSHFIKNSGGAMLRSHLELTADVVFHQLTEESVVGIPQHIIISYSRSDKHFFHLWQASDCSENIKILAVVGMQSLARSRRKTFFTLAKTFFKLNKTACISEIGGRTADIVDISLEVRLFGQKLCFSDD